MSPLASICTSACSRRKQLCLSVCRGGRGLFKARHRPRLLLRGGYYSKENRCWAPTINSWQVALGKRCSAEELTARSVILLCRGSDLLELSRSHLFAWQEQLLIIQGPTAAAGNIQWWAKPRRCKSAIPWGICFPTQSRKQSDVRVGTFHIHLPPGGLPSFFPPFFQSVLGNCNATFTVNFTWCPSGLFDTA